MPVRIAHDLHRASRVKRNRLRHRSQEPSLQTTVSMRAYDHEICIPALGLVENGLRGILLQHPARHRDVRFSGQTSFGTLHAPWRTLPVLLERLDVRGLDDNVAVLQHELLLDDERGRTEMNVYRFLVRPEDDVSTSITIHRTSVHRAGSPGEMEGLSTREVAKVMRCRKATSRRTCIGRGSRFSGSPRRSDMTVQARPTARSRKLLLELSR
jgi:hypothetical protein